jgi:hypothetical protein
MQTLDSGCRGKEVGLLLALRKSDVRDHSYSSIMPTKRVEYENSQKTWTKTLTLPLRTSLLAYYLVEIGRKKFVYD